MNILIKQAFTLIELLVVIAIIGILSGLIVVAMGGMTDKANIAKAQVFSNSLRNSLMSDIVGEWKLDEGANSVAINTWGGFANGSLSGFADTTAGYGDTHTSGWMSSSNCVFGTCLNFDGVDDIINCSSSSNYLSSNFTIGVWANSSTKFWHYVLGNGTYNVANAFAIVETQNSYGYGVYYDTSSGQPRQLFSSVFAPGKWKYITVTYDNAYLKIYIDGVYRNQVARTGTFVGSNLKIGDDGASARYWYGRIDDIRIYDSVIPTSQIKEQYYAGLNNLLINGGITKEEYQSRVLDLNNGYATK